MQPLTIKPIFIATNLNVPQDRGLAKNSALWDFEEERLLVQVQHVQLAAHKDEHVTADLACEVRLGISGHLLVTMACQGAMRAPALLSSCQHLKRDKRVFARAPRQMCCSLPSRVHMACAHCLRCVLETHLPLWYTNVSREQPVCCSLTHTSVRNTSS